MRYNTTIQSHISALKGQIIQKIEKHEARLVFHINDEWAYVMYHKQNCCEIVEIEDICGELDWLIGEPVLIAEERTNSDQPKKFNPDDKFWHCENSFKWTFYELATIKGSVTIRWYGSSNGYYSEAVDFEVFSPKEERLYNSPEKVEERRKARDERAKVYLENDRLREEAKKKEKEYNDFFRGIGYQPKITEKKSADFEAYCFNTIKKIPDGLE